MQLPTAVRARPGWSLLALVTAVACACVLPWDARIQPPLRALDGGAGAGAWVELVVPFGRGEVAVLLALLVAAAGRRRLAAQMLVALGVAAVLTWALKLGVQRIRPNGQAFSFVSGDTSTAFAVIPLLARGWLSGAACLLVAIGVALSRVVLGYHWPADVLGGAAIGLMAGVSAPWLTPRRWLPGTWRPWLLVGVSAIVVAAILAWMKAGFMRTTVCVWGPAILLLTVMPRLRLLLRRGVSSRALPWTVGVVAIALFALACTTTLWDRDEPRNALAAREMVASGDYLVPTFNGEPRLHKPILPYWMMTAALRSGLPTDLACRLPAVLCMALAVWLTALTARRLAVAAGTDPDRLGLWTAFIIATSPLALVTGSAATTDAALLCGLAATAWVLVGALQEGVRWWTTPALGLGVAWALLAKGPMGLLVPGSLVVGWACGRQGFPNRFWWAFSGGLVFGSALALAWFLPANAATEGRMFAEMIGKHVVDRGLKPMESHGGNFWLSLPYYVPVGLIMLLAWLPALSALRLDVLDRPRRALLLAWCLPVFVIVTLYQTKLPHYLLPALPGAAILVSAATLRGGPGRWGWRVQAGLLLLLAVGLLAGPLLVLVGAERGLVSLPVSLAPLVAPAWALGLVLAGWCWWSWRLRERGLVGWGLAGVAGMTALVLVLVLDGRRLEVYKPAPRMAAEVRRLVPLGVPIATCGFDEPSLYYYMGPDRGPVRNIPGRDQLRNWSLEPGAGVCVATATMAEAVPQLVRLASVPGYNYSNGKVVELVLLSR